jgi:hypothetical protein
MRIGLLESINQTHGSSTPSSESDILFASPAKKQAKMDDSRPSPQALSKGDSRSSSSHKSLGARRQMEVGRINTASQNDEASSSVFCCCAVDKKPQKMSAAVNQNLEECFTPQTKSSTDDDGDSYDGDRLRPNRKAGGRPYAFVRRGAKCPVDGMLLKNGKRLYVPRLQLACPVAFDAFLERRIMVARQQQQRSNETVQHDNKNSGEEEDFEATLKILKFSLRPILLSDMQAF